MQIFSYSVTLKHEFSLTVVRSAYQCNHFSTSSHPRGCRTSKPWKFVLFPIRHSTFGEGVIWCAVAKLSTQKWLDIFNIGSGPICYFNLPSKPHDSFKSSVMVKWDVIFDTHPSGLHFSVLPPQQGLIMQH
ncbi:hypothetical protein EGR_03851 [Echinococcus granulosus]|uniref:Uncharacterized protein n=1 Tax=Echinococcus granulosus TaxID=6210 RepID=W6UIP8_ECHGR|nr:hypothetical protein EGR_03851 [Echinococcus granulosus]EUB61365.1 hypothetical protein EGR_03851 [Echinococcus granulosus]